MPLSLTCSKVSQDADGRVYVAFTDGVVLEFPSKTDALGWAKVTDVGVDSEAQLLLRRLLLAWWIKGDPTGATPATVVGKTITANLTLAGIVTVG